MVDCILSLSPFLVLVICAFVTNSTFGSFLVVDLVLFLNHLKHIFELSEKT